MCVAQMKYLGNTIQNFTANMCVAQMKCLGNTIRNFTATMCVAHVCHPLLLLMYAVWGSTHTHYYVWLYVFFSKQK